MCGVGSTSTHQGGLDANALGSLEGQGQILDLEESKRSADGELRSAATQHDPHKYKPAATPETQLDGVSASACLWGFQRSVPSSVFVCKVLGCLASISALFNVVLIHTHSMYEGESSVSTSTKVFVIVADFDFWT